MRSAHRGPPQTCPLGARAGTVAGRAGAVAARTQAGATKACRPANRRAAAARQMTHASPRALALTHFPGFRFGIQRVRIDVRRPQCRRQQQPAYHHHKTKTARFPLEHLGFVPSNARLSLFPRMHEACQSAGFDGNLGQFPDTTGVRAFQAIQKFQS